ncbi:MAG: ArsR family transcriptional regulator [Candidatus Aenigmarchaeota archaeon]|nr:ArsR family transcriptional regulator [Candidatus Aenigmarchaeota archaeon]
MLLFSEVNTKSTNKLLLRFFKSQRFVEILRFAAFYRDLTLSSAAKRIATALKMSESTVKWHLRKMREMKLITCGDKNNPYKPLRLTELGWEVFSMVEGDTID